MEEQTSCIWFYLVFFLVLALHNSRRLGFGSAQLCMNMPRLQA